jgi:NADPH:quinone reductase-like Zn-dependent oxidoreductase
VIADLKAILGASRTSRSSRKLVSVAEVEYTAEALKRLVVLAESGRLLPVIDRTYELEHIVEAHRYVETGRKRGSVILDLP